MTYGSHLLQHDLDLATARRALAPCGPAPLCHEPCRDAGRTPAEPFVLANDDDVEVVGRDGPQLTDVIVAAVSSGPIMPIREGLPSSD